MFFDQVQEGKISPLVGFFEYCQEISDRLMIMNSKRESKLAHLKQLYLEVNVLAGIGPDVVDQVIDIVRRLSQIVVQTTDLDHQLQCAIFLIERIGERPERN